MKSKNTLHIVQTILVVLLIVFAILFYRLVKEYDHLRRVEVANSYRELIANIKKNRSLTSGDVSVIQQWMTFDYVNRVFNLPPEYLKNSLTIIDPKYPKVVISKYAKNQKFDVGIFMTTLQNAVGDYIKSHQ
ncbi:MAG: hypothetical protein WCK48_00840 [bacterium]